MAEFFQSSIAQGVITLALGAALATVGVYLVLWFRREAVGPETPLTGTLMSEFRELYSRGELTEEEYRSIKSRLTARFQEEIDDEPAPSQQSRSAG